MQVLQKKVYREKYEILSEIRTHVGFEAAPNPLGDITTAPHCLLKTSFMGQYYA